MNFVRKTDEGKAESITFVNFCFTGLVFGLQGWPMDGGWWRDVESFL